MNPTEKQMIDDLIAKLAQAQQQSKANGQEPESEAAQYIANRLSDIPDASYYMAQTMVVQGHALEGLTARVEELEYQLSQAQKPKGFLSSLFGGGAQQSAAAQHRSQGRHPQQQMGQGRPGAFGGGMGQAYGQAPQGSFLGGAMQTAVGVAGGVLLGNAVASMFAGDAMAAPAEDAGADAGAGGDEMGMDDSSMIEEPRLEDGDFGFDDFGGDMEF